LDRAAAARAALLATKTGALATLSADEATLGWPFGSVVPFALTAEGAPAILIADIAQHTRNLERDGRASLLVKQPSAPGVDPQAGWRVTLMGRMRRAADDGSLEELHARYVERVPDAPDYFRTHGFSYWTMEIVRVRWIGGFGDIGWLAPADVLREPGGEGLSEAADGIIRHMNEDHADVLAAICEWRHGFRPAAARMTAIDRAGFLFRTSGPDRLVHVSFGREIRAAEAREVFIDLARAARRALGKG
jgi:hypothetical protein